MDASDWTALGVLLALGTAVAVRLRAWKRPRAVIVVGVLITFGVIIGALIGLILAGIDSMSSTALWLPPLALIGFEVYRWRRRRRLRP
ncbi:MAG TPA: hypothetical protein VK821_03990 [Dehalococcoidia bacterium]|nr:hypothetical protein [Dehalococcoidia bacterium]